MPEVSIKHRKIKNLIKKYENIWALSYFLNLANWDTETYMPEQGTIVRGEACARLNLLIQKEVLNPEFIKLVKETSAEQDLTASERGIIRILTKQIDTYQKLPKEFLEAYTTLITSSSLIWAKAKRANDFSIFSDVLERIFTLSRQKAEYLGYKDHPYDALLDEYEQDITVKDLDKFFTEIKNFLTENFSEEIAKNKGKLATFTQEAYDQEAMARLNLKVLQYFGANPQNLRLDKSSHPFTATISTKDVRITTRYPQTGFTGSLLSTVHEFGHALYTLQHAALIEKTPLFTINSLGLHESQSRFWENHVGKSAGFIKTFYTDFLSLGKNFKKYSWQDFYQNFNFISPSLIRTEADEVTYNYHILIRYEVEKALLSGTIKVKDLVEFWNDKYQKYLGIIPKNLSEGVLQDIHWSCGLIGYFPSYALGTVLSATWQKQLVLDLQTDLNSLINSQTGINKIKAWQKEKIHQYGYTYTLEELVKKVTAKNFSTIDWQGYLQKKYLY